MRNNNSILEFNDKLLNNLCNQIILTLEYTLNGLKDMLLEICSLFQEFKILI